MEMLKRTVENKFYIPDDFQAPNSATDTLLRHICMTEFCNGFMWSTMEELSGYKRVTHAQKIGYICTMIRNGILREDEQQIDSIKSPLYQALLLGAIASVDITPVAELLLKEYKEITRSKTASKK